MRLGLRARLTLMYGALVLATGIALLVVINVTQARASASAVEKVVVQGQSSAGPVVVGRQESGFSAGTSVGTPKSVLAASLVRDDTLHHLMLVSAISIGALAVLAVLIGWWLSGRMLRPVREMTATARRLSRDNLGERVDVGRADDELRELAATFNGMLCRLQAAFDGQTRFVFNASHELRTPLALQRAAIEIGLGDTSAHSTGNVARVRGDLLAANRRIERLIDGLLLLARGDRGLDHVEPVPLHALAEDVAGQYGPAAEEAGVKLERRTAPAWVDGDPVLLTHLVRNLVQNAVAYNVPDGTVEIEVSPGCELLVRNTGPVIPADRVEGLFEPFRRLGAPRTRSERSSGLGLSIVRSIAAAHDGYATATANPGGGLEVRVRLRASAGHTLPIGGRAPGPRVPAGCG